jgi:hypothetical protein
MVGFGSFFKTGTDYRRHTGRSYGLFVLFKRGHPPNLKGTEGTERGGSIAQYNPFKGGPKVKLRHYRCPRSRGFVLVLFTKPR